MMRVPCCEKMGLKKGLWTHEEDGILISYIEQYGHANWRALPKQAGLLRCGKSCRLRWFNYLRPDIKRGNFSKEEEETILKLHQVVGNRWSAIASRLPGRTDNEIKNFWNSHLKKRLQLQAPAAATAAAAPDIATPTKMSSQYAAVFPPQPQSHVLSRPSELATIASRTLSRLDHADPQKDFLSKSTCPTTPKSPNINVDPGLIQPPFMKNDFGSKTSEDMDFWYSLFVKAGEPSRIPLPDGESAKLE